MPDEIEYDKSKHRLRVETRSGETEVTLNFADQRQARVGLNLLAGVPVDNIAEQFRALLTSSIAHKIPDDLESCHATIADLSVRSIAA